MFGQQNQTPLLKPVGLGLRAPMIGLPARPFLLQGLQPQALPSSPGQISMQGSLLPNSTLAQSHTTASATRIGPAIRLNQSPVFRPQASSPSPATSTDPHLEKVKEIRSASSLMYIPVKEALRVFKESAGEEANLSQNQFRMAYVRLLSEKGITAPSADVQQALFELFDKDKNGMVDMMELVCGISLFCQGNEEDKIKAVFRVFDENDDGFISMDEMFKFLSSVFRVMLTPTVVETMKRMGYEVDSAEDLASVTALECFKMADLNHDGKLSLQEFNNWFYAPKNDPTFLFHPTSVLSK